MLAVINYGVFFGLVIAHTIFAAVKIGRAHV